MRIHFLGTNGWYCTGTGLTPCILIETFESYIVLDAGEGIHKLEGLIQNDEKPIYLFLTHFHLDHITGFHLLSKFGFKQGLDIFGKIGTRRIIDLIINEPFTTKLTDLPFEVKVKELDEGTYSSPLSFSCRLLPHPDLSMGYRFQIEDKIITYCTDTRPHENITSLALNADLFISECAYLPGETYSLGTHLNPTDAAAIAKKSGVKRLILTHFSADRYRTTEKRLEAEKDARTIFRDTIAAFDNLEIQV